MSVRFAAARCARRSPVARALTSPAAVHPANDCASSEETDPLLTAALRHFAMHGLGAVAAALAEAKRAHDADDLDAFERWLAIGALFDRRTVAAFRRRTKPHPAIANHLQR